MRYSLIHPNTVTVNFATLQRVGDYLFNFRNSPDFGEYEIKDKETGNNYAVKNCDSVNGIEFLQTN